MADGKPRTINEIRQLIGGGTDAGITARLREMRYLEYGDWIVECMPKAEGESLYWVLERALKVPPYDSKYGTEEAYRCYCELVKEVAEIDREAAEYLTKVDQINTFDYAGSLITAFLWSIQPQGDDYWRKIDGELNARRRESK